MGYTVLVVDDDDLNREVMEAFLSIEGYNILMTGSGQKAVEMTQTHIPDLVLLDVRLPDIGGIEVCKMLKSNPQTAPIPIMMITGLSDEVVRYQAMTAGVTVFLPRPFELDDFVAKVRNILARQN